MNQLTRSKWMPVIQNLAISVIAVIVSLAVSAVIMLVVGYNPAEAFSAMLKGAFSNSNAIANTLAKTVPLIFVGLACAFTNKGGLFNIGGEGQLYMGGFCATVAALAIPGAPRLVIIVVAFIAGMAGGALVGGFNGLLKAKLHINEVIVAIMLNYILTNFTSYWVNGPLKEEGSMIAQSPSIGAENMLTTLIPRTQLTTALIIALAVAVIMHFFFAKTRMGYNIRAVGENGTAAEASGVAMASTIVMTMAISGAIAGLAGVTEIFGKTEKFIDGFSPGYGFTGIAIAVLGQDNPFGVVLAALLFGIMDAGSMQMSFAAGVSASMISVMQGLVILFVATPRLVSFLHIGKGAK